MYTSGRDGLAVRLKKKRKKVKNEKRGKNNCNNRREEMNTEFGARHKIVVVWPCSRGSARGDYLMHREDGMLLR